MRFLAVIPLYNHGKTVRQVVQGCLRCGWPVLVVDDGSTDEGPLSLRSLQVTVLTLPTNRGKGEAVLQAAAWARENGFTHILTLDADGQHNPQDLALLAQSARQYPQSIIIGARRFEGPDVPASSKFGRKFAGFWVHLQTGKAVSDMQSGLRCYPVQLLEVVKCWCRRYAFEVEIVVRALWAGFGVKEVEVSVFYPPAGKRVSHFHKLADNLRLTLINTHLTMRSMLPFPHRQYACPAGSAAGVKKRGYWEVMLENLRQKDSITRNAFSGAWGIFCGSIALPGVRQVMLFWGAGWWNLNKILSISFEKLCIGPFVPALCIEAGFFMRNGRFLTEFTLQTLGRQFLQRVWEWVLGSLVVAPLLAAAAFLIVWIIGYFLHRSLK